MRVEVVRRLTEDGKRRRLRPLISLGKKIRHARVPDDLEIRSFREEVRPGNPPPGTLGYGQQLEFLREGLCVLGYAKYVARCKAGPVRIGIKVLLKVVIGGDGHQINRREVDIEAQISGHLLVANHRIDGRGHFVHVPTTDPARRNP